jgi:hypothetical protein
MIVSIINEAFGGDINDKRPLHINSMCRIAYAGYLKYHKKYKAKEIAVITKSLYGTAIDRIKKHRDLYAVDLIYKKTFDNMIKKTECL